MVGPFFFIVLADTSCGANDRRESSVYLREDATLSGKRPFRDDVSSTSSSAQRSESSSQKSTQTPSDQSATFSPFSSLKKDSLVLIQSGLATWYGSSAAGRRTASGESFDPSQYTAAHRTLPFGTILLVKREDSQKSVRVRINDRGPFGDPKKVIDLSKRAAEEIGAIRDGVVSVKLYKFK